MRQHWASIPRNVRRCCLLDLHNKGGSGRGGCHASAAVQRQHVAGAGQSRVPEAVQKLLFEIECAECPLIESFRHGPDSNPLSSGYTGIVSHTRRVSLTAGADLIVMLCIGQCWTDTQAGGQSFSNKPCYICCFFLTGFLEFLRVRTRCRQPKRHAQ